MKQQSTMLMRREVNGILSSTPRFSGLSLTPRFSGVNGRTNGKTVSTVLQMDLGEQKAKPNVLTLLFPRVN
jgi:hypothetical protein